MDDDDNLHSSCEPFRFELHDLLDSFKLNVDVISPDLPYLAVIAFVWARRHGNVPILSKRVEIVHP